MTKSNVVQNLHSYSLEVKEKNYIAQNYLMAFLNIIFWHSSILVYDLINGIPQHYVMALWYSPTVTNKIPQRYYVIALWHSSKWQLLVVAVVDFGGRFDDSFPTCAFYFFSFFFFSSGDQLVPMHTSSTL